MSVVMYVCFASAIVLAIAHAVQNIRETNENNQR